jgi:hypothetical protein
VSEPVWAPGAAHRRSALDGAVPYQKVKRVGHGFRNFDTTGCGCCCTAASLGRQPRPRDCEGTHHVSWRRAPKRPVRANACGRRPRLSPPTLADGRSSRPACAEDGSMIPDEDGHLVIGPALDRRRDGRGSQAVPPGQRPPDLPALGATLDQWTATAVTPSKGGCRLSSPGRHRSPAEHSTASLTSQAVGSRNGSIGRRACVAAPA